MLSQTFKDTPAEVRTSLQGLARLSDTICSRDAQLNTLLSATRKVTQVLADRNGEFTKLILDSNTLLTEVQRRRALIDSILKSTQELSRQLSGPGQRQPDRADTGAAAARHGDRHPVAQPGGTSAQTINNLAPFVRVFTNTLGNGRWFDSFVDNLLPAVVGWRALRGRLRDPAAGDLLGGQVMSGRLQRGVAGAAVLVLLVALGLTILRPAGQYRVTAYFKQTVGLYPGSSVRILGIAVGTVDTIVPQGDRVKVSMSLDDNYAVPADADAVVLAPSLVSDRYVQFSPVYDGGPKMKDGATVPLERTATPVELDQVYGALDDLSAALGPNGANKNGALSDLVDVGAANLKGNGEAAQPHAHRLLPGGRRRWPTTATTCSPPWTTCRSFTSALASIDAQVGPVQHQPRRGRRSSWPASARTWPPRSRCCPRRSATSPGSCAPTRRC